MFFTNFKMVDEAEIVKIYYRKGNFPTKVLKQLRKQYPNENLPNRKQIRRIVTKFE